MSKFTDAIKAGLKAYFETGDTPTEAQFAEWIDAIQDGIQEHLHKSTGGAASGTGDAARIGADALLVTDEARGDILFRAAAAWGRLPAGTSGKFLMTQGGAADPVWALLPSNLKRASPTFIIDGGGSPITTGQKGHLHIPFNCTIDQVTMLADQSGSIVVDIWKDTYANFPPTVGDSITASAVPTISGAQKSQDSTLTGWTTSITTGDILAYNVDSCASITRVTISLRASKT